MTLTMEEFEGYADTHAGYCKVCEDITHDCCEPDAHGYECPVCGNPSVYGMEECLIEQLIDIVD